MRTQASTAWILKWAVAGVFVAACVPLARGQYQTDNSTGRARDANNRLGSGGFNDQRALPNGVTSEDIVYGNVTRAQGFRGPLSTRDAREFRAQTAGTSVGNFVRDSAGANQDPNQAFSPQRFYTDSKGVAAPAGYATEASVADFGRSLTDARGPVVGDLRQNVAPVNPLSNAPGMPGESDPLRPTLISPLTAPGMGMTAPLGMPVWQAQTGLPSDGAMESSLPGALRRLRMNGASIRMMQEELSTTAEQPLDSTERIGADKGLSSPENPQNPALKGALTAPGQTGPLTGSLNTSVTLRQNLLTSVPTAAKQSTQYAELQRRLLARPKAGSGDQIAAQNYNEQVRLQQEQLAKTKLAAAAAAEPNATGLQGGNADPVKKIPPETPTQLPPLKDSGRLSVAMRARNAETKTEAGGAVSPDSVMRITTFTEGVKASGLRGLLERAETSMRDGKFTSALDNYDAAMSVAPNNPLILMARANAELGAGYYARAQTHIEQIFAADSSLLLAQYDLRVFFGDERLQYLVRDLKDVAQTEPGQPRPLFLLAYIAYNTNNPQSAADYLAAAEQRGGKDPIFDKLRDFWKLPKAGAGGSMPDNK